MTKTSIPWTGRDHVVGFGDSPAADTYAVVTPGEGIRTSDRLIPLPGEDVLFLRANLFRGILHLAGQGHDTGACWYWDGATWSTPCQTFGTSPCVFAPNQLLIQSGPDLVRTVYLDDPSVVTPDRPMDVGSQGFRFWTLNQGAITGDATYKHPTLPLWEYTYDPDVMIGQGENGAVVYVGGSLRMLEVGGCYFIRVANPSAEMYQITIVKQLDGVTLVYSMSLAELRDLPIVGADTPPPTTPVQPIPTKAPMTIPNQLARLQRIKADLIAAGQDLSGPNAGKIVKQLCYELRDLGAARFAKPGGNNFESTSVDWVVFPDGQAGDILGDAGGANTPTWGLESHPEMIDGRVPVTTDPGYLTGVVIAPPAPVPPTSLEARLAALEARVTLIEATMPKRTGGLAARAAALEVVDADQERRLVALEARPLVGAPRKILIDIPVVKGNGFSLRARGDVTL